jgi:hypothetical protein
MRRHPTAPVYVAGITVATPGTGFTALEADFARLSGPRIATTLSRAGKPRDQALD